MKTLTIEKIHYKNFKGLNNFALELNGQDLSILGDNGAGKTTLFDGFTFLLFGTDSRGKKDFEILPLNDQGEVDQTEAEVEAVLSLNNKPITLMRRYKQKHTKRRGEAKKAFTGHTSEFEIDGVPATKSSFDKAVAEIIDINSFKLVTNPYEFNLIPWKARRDLLLEICGDVSDSDVITSDKKLSGLAVILGENKSIDDIRKVAAAQKAKINKKLEEIPARIDEHKGTIQDVAAPDLKEKARLESALEDAREKLRGLQSNERLSAKKVRINEIDAEILKADNEAQVKVQEQRKPILSMIENLESTNRDIKNRMESLKDSITRDEKRNAIVSESLEKLRAEWREIKQSQYKGDNICPACGQALPADQVEAAVEKFNQEKARKLADNLATGKQSAQAMKDREKDIAKTQADIEALIISYGDNGAEINRLTEQLNAVDVQVDATSSLEKEKKILESEIAALENGAAIQEETAKGKITEAQAALDEWTRQKAAYDTAEASRKRVAELEQKEKDLAAEFERLEQELFLAEKFIVRKVELLEGKINSRFKMARFKMFEKQINGGVKECCETIYNGIPYNHGLNSAARINVGLDIIATLSEHFGFSAPIFIDNAESINEAIPMPSQVISLVVSRDEQLTVSETEALKAS